MPLYLVTLEVQTLVDIEVEAADEKAAFKQASENFLEEPDATMIDWRYECCQVKGEAWMPEELD